MRPLTGVGVPLTTICDSALSQLLVDWEMGAFLSKKPIPQRTPLGCTLKHWKDIGGDDPLTRKPLIEYCNHWCPTYQLEGGHEWPEQETLQYHTILQLMLFCKKGRQMGRSGIC